MAFDRVAFFIGAPDDSHVGPKHSAEVTRQFIFDATGGSEGVSTPDSLKVVPLNVPGGGVRILPGGCILRNRYPGGQGQSYEGRASTETEVTVPAASSAGSRTDMLVARILDPQYEGSPPADPNDFDYCRPELIQGVPAGIKKFSELGRNYPGIALAKWTQAASTNNLTTSKIIDLREVAQPGSWPDMETYSMTGAELDNLGETGAYPDGGETFPSVTEGAWQGFDIPDRATWVNIKATLAGVRVPTGQSRGFIWVMLGDPNDPDHVSTQGTRYEEDGTDRIDLVAGGKIRIPPIYRGTRQRFRIRGNKEVGDVSLQMNAGSTAWLEVQFVERAD